MHYNSGFDFKVSKGFQIIFQVVLEIECEFGMHTSVNVSLNTSVKDSVNGPRCKYALQARIWFQSVEGISNSFPSRAGNKMRVWKAYFRKSFRKYFRKKKKTKSAPLKQNDNNSHELL
jgi:hypothetical protein